MASISSLRASAPGPKAAIDQPPPVIQGSFGFASAQFLIFATYSSTVVSALRSQAFASMPPEIGWMCTSCMPGSTMRPLRSMTWVCGPM